MSYYNDLHAGLIPGTEEIPEGAFVSDAIRSMVPRTDTPWMGDGSKVDVNEAMGLKMVRLTRTSQSGDGVQPYSKGDFYPWVWTMVGPSPVEDLGYRMFYKHPDGRVTRNRWFGNWDKTDIFGFNAAHKRADADVAAAIEEDRHGS